MQYRRLGRTDLKVSLICLGTMTWGQQNSEAEAHEQLDYALAQGINFIDTAEMYPVPPVAKTQGLTEAYIGSWLKKRGQRDEVILATKVSGPAEDWLEYLRGGPRLERRHITEALHDSLKRLQTDYVDLYQVHWPARKTNFFGQLGFEPVDESEVPPIAETLEILADLVDDGKIRHIGVSNETPWGVMRYLEDAERDGTPRIVSIQNPYSLLNRSFEVGLAEIAYREQVGLLAYSPLAFGTLSGKYLDGARPKDARLSLFERFTRYTNPQGESAASAYVELARRRGLDPAQMALAYVNSRPFVTATIVGATTMEQLAADITSADLTLAPEVLAQIQAIHVDQPNPCP
jgi:aryl-alcohol dehydrogenase-like predicted oxidoreductase